MKTMLACGMSAFFCLAGFALPVDVSHIEFNREWEPEAATGNPACAVRTAEGWLVDIPKTGRVEALPLPHSAWSAAPPSAVTLQALASHGRALVKLNFVERSGKMFSTKAQWIEAGASRLVFSLAGMETPSCRLLSLSIEPEGPETKLLLKRVLYVEERPESEALQLSIDSGDEMISAFDRDSFSKARLILRNGSAQPIQGVRKLRFADLYGHAFEWELETDLEPYAEKAVSMPSDPPHRGVWYGPAASDGRRMKFAFITPNGLDRAPNSEFEFAIDNHWIDAAGIEAMRYMGIRAVRSIVSWERIQPQSAAGWRFDKFDQRLVPLEKAGIKMRETLCFTPRWAVVDNPKNLPFPRNRMPQLKAWENYVRAMVKRYGSRVELFELWNEPDLRGFVDFPAEDYLKLCRIAREVVNEENPKCKLASGGFATMRPSIPEAPKFQEAVLSDCAGLFDFHSYHEHGYFPHFQQMVDGYFLPLRKKHGITLPWFASETAMHSAKGLDAQQADCLFKKLLFSWARGAFSYTWYGLFDNGYDLNYSEDNFGLVDRFCEPKYGFGVYAALIGLYREASFSGQMKAKGNPWMFQFRTPNAMLLAHWSKQPQDGSIVYAVYGAGHSAESIDLNGNADALPFRDGAALVPVVSTGGTMRLAGAKSIDSVEPAMELKMPEALLPGKPTTANLELFNPWRTAVKIALRPESLEGCKVSGLPESVAIAPEEHKALAFQLAMDKDCADQEWKIDLAINGVAEPLTVSGKLNPAKWCPDADFQNREPDFRLEDYSMVSGNFEFDPARAAALWRGFDDLTGTVWLGRDGDCLKFQVIVRDRDRHPSPDPARLWEGDSVQIALGFPEQQGHFEFGAGLDAAGRAATGVWAVPAGFQPEAVRKQLRVSIYPGDPCTAYQFSIPLPALGVNAEKLAKGFQFNILLNDNDDGKGRKCFIRLAPGIGDSQTMEHSPLVICP